MDKRLVVVFNTDANRRFTMNFRNPNEALTEAEIHCKSPVRICIKYNNQTNRRFTMNFRNPNEALTEAELLEAAQKLIDTNALDPMQGKPIDVHSAKIVST